MKKLVTILVMATVVFVSGLRAQAQIDNAKALLKQGKANEALVILRQAVESNSRNAEIWQLMAQAYLKTSNLDSAKIAGERVISLDEKNVSGYLLLYQIEEKQGDIKSAHTTLITGLTENKSNGQLLIALGRLLLRADSVDRAIVALTQAKEAMPNAPAIYDGLGDAYDRQGVPAFAITQYEKSTELDSTNAVVFQKLGKLYYKERRFNDAARAYAKVVELDPANKEILLELAKMYLASRPRQYDNAAKYLKLYTQRFPNEAEPWSMYTESLFYLRRFQDVLDPAQKALKLNPNDVKVLRCLATSQYALSNYKESIDAYKKLEQVDSLKVDDLTRLGESYLALKDRKSAIDAFDQVLKKDPSQVEIYNKAAMALMNEHEYADAAALFQRRYMSDTSSRSMSAYLNYASCKIAIKEYDSAKVAYREFISKKPDYPNAWLGLARSLILQSSDSLQVSRKAYEEFVRLIPASEESKNKKELQEAYKNIGVAFLVDKKYDSAIAPLKKALQFDEGDDELHTRLGQAYTLTGDKEDAIKEYQKALKLNPKSKDAKKGLEMLGIPVD